MSCISECDCKTFNRPGRNQGKPSCTIDFSGKMDPEREEHDGIWSGPFHRTRAWSRTSRTCSKDSVIPSYHRRIPVIIRQVALRRFLLQHFRTNLHGFSPKFSKFVRYCFYPCGHRVCNSPICPQQELKYFNTTIKSDFISTFNLFVGICSKSEMLLSSEIV